MCLFFSKYVPYSHVFQICQTFSPKVTNSTVVFHHSAQVRHTSHLFSAFPPIAQTTRTNTLQNEHSSLSINIQVSLGSSLYLVRRLPRRQTARRFRRWRTTRGIRRRRRHRRDASIAGEDWDGAIILPEIPCGGGGGGGCVPPFHGCAVFLWLRTTRRFRWRRTMQHLDFVHYCPYPIVGGDDWEGAIILPEIACGSSCGGGFVVVVVVDVIPL